MKFSSIFYATVKWDNTFYDIEGGIVFYVPGDPKKRNFTS